jgi:hypothetical protein
MRANGTPLCSYTMRPKARGLAKHGGPPGWLEESDPAPQQVVILDVIYGRSMPSALTDHTMHLPRSGADLLINVL